jgi:hypothetical protein
MGSKQARSDPGIMDKDFPAALTRHLSETPPHLLSPFWSGDKAPGSALQYQYGNGPWFERLCFRLIIREGHAAQYFGRNGQAQFGIDFISTFGGKLWYWQCKNRCEGVTPADLRDSVAKLEREALVKQGLPAPDHFVVCYTGPVKDTKVPAERARLSARLWKERRTEFELWDEQLLSEKLQSAPDIVAEMFGNPAVAPHCGIDPWRADMWAPLADGALPDCLRSYAKARRSRTVWRNEEGENAWFPRLTSTIRDHSVTILCGVSGAGKTFASLSACEALAGWRCYFLHLPAETATSAHDIAEGMRQRLSYPTLFILDDVHADFDKVANVVDKLKRLSLGKEWRVICTARRAGEDADDLERADRNDWLDQIEEEGGLFPLALNDEGLSSFMLSLRPDWSGVRRDILIRLANACGRNLRLIREACDRRFESPPEVSKDGIRRILRTAREVYFSRVGARGTWFRFAALTTYGIDPRIDYFPREEREDIDRLKDEDVVWIYTQGHPACYSTEHPAASELLLHAVAVEDDATGSLKQQISSCLTDYCVWLAKREVSACVQVLLTVLRSHPVLIPVADNLALKAAMIGHDALLDRWLDHARRYDLSILALASFVCARAGTDLAHRLASLYAEEIRERLNQGASEFPNDPHWFAQLSLGLRTLRSCTPQVYSGLMHETRNEAWIRLIGSGTLPDLLRLLEYSAPEFSERLIEALDDARIDAIITNTEKAGRSLGTLDLALRELGRRDQRWKTGLLPDLEARIGPQRWLKLMRRGTLPDLLHLIERSTPEFSRRLIEALDEEQVDAIITNTENAKRSLGTLDLALRELGRRDERQKTGLLPGQEEAKTGLLSGLEAKIGPQRWLALMKRGTLPDLLDLLRYSTPEFSGRLIEALDAAQLDAVIANTKAAGRSLGTLDFALRELGRHEHLNTTLLSDLEAKIGPQRWLALMSRGTLPDLLHLLRRSTPEFSRRLIEALDEERVDAIITNTEKAERSLGTLGLALRELGLHDEPVKTGLLSGLEAKIGPQRWLALMSRGSLPDLLRLLENSTPEFSGRLIEALDSARLDAVIANTKAAGRSLGNINSSFNALARRGDQKDKLEKAIGPDRLAQSLLVAGTLGAACDVMCSLSKMFRAACLSALLAQPLEAWLACMLRPLPKKRFFELCEWLRECGPDMRDATGSAAVLEGLCDTGRKLVAESSWYGLRSGLHLLPGSSVVAQTDWLRQAAAVRVANAQLRDLAATDWDDLANMPELIWDTRPQLQQAWANQVVIRFAGEVEDAKVYARWEPALLFWLHKDVFSTETATQLLHEALQPPRVKPFLEAKNSVNLIVHFWNALSVIYERRVEPNPVDAERWLAFVREFGKSVPDETRRLVCNWVASTASKPIAFQAYGTLLQLLGLMHLLGWDSSLASERLRETSGRKFTVWKCLDDNKLGFVSLSLVQLGARECLGDPVAFRRDRCDLLLAKYRDMCGQPTAMILRSVHELAEWVKGEGAAVAGRPVM